MHSEQNMFMIWRYRHERRVGRLLAAENGRKKKRKKHGRSIMQAGKYCYLCARFYGDYGRKPVQKHHIVFGRGNRQISEELGLTVYLCDQHHEHGPDAVHVNHEMARILQADAQETYEQTHTREERMERIGRHYKL